ncbi:transcription elongation factor GreB [Larsenimonas rhizosphaerae]|uniref:Transcription elongation factor GreB n=1 Tax=Larsenimonas rhizosphaerae TaxID=2944682 RepID=A0AA41ZMS0_9GAMM|nr:transcription elongation factor GreB [Larsenimonas rhizosphaerae]MCM2131974.1 transcription elongation factor GreB [Larsenimonas rhizosphaerae]MCX2524728.1 transcription elongation factor GreB [Larsenimonas rhizosphaerae]
MKGRNMSRWRDPATDPRQEKKTNLITPQGYARMEGLLNHLARERRPELSRKTGEAAAQGDRSENADYTYNKRELNKTISRIAYLQKRLDALTVVSRRPDDTSRVFFSAWVTLEDDEGEEMTVRIVGPDETDTRKHWISIDAPLARALLGKELDADINVDAPGGSTHYIITDIDYDGPDA